MKHLYLGLGILAVLLILGLLSLFLLTDRLESAALILNEAYAQAVKGRPQEARETALHARGRWEAMYGLTASLVDHGPLDEVNRAFAELEAQEEPGDLAGTCRALSCLIRGIARREKPLYYNIL